MSSSSSSSQSTVNETTTNDERIAADNGASIVRADGAGIVNVTDGGAIDLAETLAADAFEVAEGLGGIAQQLSMESLDFARDTVASSRTEQAQFFDQLMTYAIPALALVFIARSYFK